MKHKSTDDRIPRVNSVLVGAPMPAGLMLFAGHARMPVSRRIWEKKSSLRTNHNVTSQPFTACDVLLAVTIFNDMAIIVLSSCQRVVGQLANMRRNQHV